MPHEIYIDDVIGEDFFGQGYTAKTLRDQLAGVDAESDITLRINSPGGSVFEAVAIRSQLADRQGSVNVRVDGVAASAASYIATIGERVEMSEGSMLMIHDPWSVVIGNSAEMRREAELLDKIGGSLSMAYVNKSGKSLEDITEAMAAETWFTAEEAVAFGLADATAESRAAACIIPAEMGYRNVPKALQPAPHKRPASDYAARLHLHRMRTEHLTSATPAA